MGKVEQSHSTL